VDYPIHLWELASGREVAQLGAHSRSAEALASREPPRKDFERRVISRDALAFSHDGRWLASGRAWPDQSDGQYTLLLRDLASLVPRYRFQGHRKSTQAIAFSPDDRRLASASWDTTVLVWDTGELAQTRLVLHPARSWERLVLPGGR